VIASTREAIDGSRVSDRVAPSKARLTEADVSHWYREQLPSKLSNRFVFLTATSCQRDGSDPCSATSTSLAASEHAPSYQEVGLTWAWHIITHTCCRQCVAKVHAHEAHAVIVGEAPSFPAPAPQCYLHHTGILQPNSNLDSASKYRSPPRSSCNGGGY
jgi:hypothetical protein